MKSFALVFAGLLLARPEHCFSDPIFTGARDILTSELNGNSTNLCCGALCVKWSRKMEQEGIDQLDSLNIHSRSGAS
jgi:hypothetical protein